MSVASDWQWPRIYVYNAMALLQSIFTREHKNGQPEDTEKYQPARLKWIKMSARCWKQDVDSRQCSVLAELKCSLHLLTTLLHTHKSEIHCSLLILRPHSLILLWILVLSVKDTVPVYQSNKWSLNKWRIIFLNRYLPKYSLRLFFFNGSKNNGTLHSPCNAHFILIRGCIQQLFRHHHLIYNNLLNINVYHHLNMKNLFAWVI